MEIGGNDMNIKRCPYCGDEQVYVEQHEAPHAGWFCECGLCELRGPRYQSKAAAVEAWNIVSGLTPKPIANAIAYEALKLSEL